MSFVLSTHWAAYWCWVVISRWPGTPTGASRSLLPTEHMSSAVQINIVVCLASLRCRVYLTWPEGARVSYTLQQCCFNVEPPSETVVQRWNNIGWINCTFWVYSSGLLAGFYKGLRVGMDTFISVITPHRTAPTAVTKRWHNAGAMLVQWKANV